MAGYSFKHLKDINRVLEYFGGEIDGQLKGPQIRTPERVTQGWIFKTPAGGIPGRVGTTCSSAACTPYSIENGVLTEIQNGNDPSGTVSFTVDVYNIFQGAIAGDTFITVKEVFNVKIADAEDCP